MGALHYLAVGLGIFFALAGLVKVAPVEPAHSHMVKEFGSFATVFPLKTVGIQPAADMYRCVIGVVEIVFGVLLAFGRHSWRSFSCVSLFVIMVGAVQTLLALGSPIPEMFPALICGGLLLLMLVHRDGLWGKSHLD